MNNWPRGKRKSYSSVPIGWIEQPTSSLRVTRSTTELNGPQFARCCWPGLQGSAGTAPNRVGRRRWGVPVHFRNHYEQRPHKSMPRSMLRRVSIYSNTVVLFVCSTFPYVSCIELRFATSLPEVRNPKGLLRVEKVPVSVPEQVSETKLLPGSNQLS